MNRFKVLTFTHLGTFLLAAVVGFTAGRYYIQNKWDKATTQTLAESQALLVRGIDDSFKLGLNYEEQRQEIRYVTKEVIREVPKYMPDTTDCRRLPSGFSRLHNKAASGPDGGPSPGSSDGAG